MLTLCQYPGCDKEAVWGVKATGESQVFKVCKKHHYTIEKTYEKVSLEKPISVLL